MDWNTIYEQRKMTAEDAVKKIKSGDRVVIGHAVSEPSHVIDAMVANAAAYENVEIVHMVAMGKCEYAKPEMAPHFRHNALFVGGGTRDAVASGRGDYTPCFFYQIPNLFATTMPVDVALVTETRPTKTSCAAWAWRWTTPRPR